MPFFKGLNFYDTEASQLTSCILVGSYFVSIHYHEEKNEFYFSSWIILLIRRTAEQVIFLGKRHKSEFCFVRCPFLFCFVRCPFLHDWKSQWIWSFTNVPFELWA